MFSQNKLREKQCNTQDSSQEFSFFCNISSTIIVSQFTKPYSKLTEVKVHLLRHANGIIEITFFISPTIRHIQKTALFISHYSSNYLLEYSGSWLFVLVIEVQIWFSSFESTYSWCFYGSNQTEKLLSNTLDPVYIYLEILIRNTFVLDMWITSSKATTFSINLEFARNC